MGDPRKPLNPKHLQETSRTVSKIPTVGIIMAVIALSAAWLGAVGTTWYADSHTCPATGAGTFASPYCRIQDAICVSASGDTVRALPGTYPEAIRMRPGVSLIASDPNGNTDPNGPATHTINSAGKPCNNSNFCTKNTGSQCSVVTFASGHSPSTTLQGFTITGGAGTFLASAPDRISGGGIYVFSSPTIINNVITNNVLVGPPQDLRGAGVYVSAGAPVITGNTITGNRAVPPAGSNNNTTYGYGGGVWVSSFSAPTVVGNIIQSNVAGDPNLAFSVGEGGGIVIFRDPNNPTLVTVDRNFIADNSTDLLGGGISTEVISSGGGQVVITNNVIVGNTASSGGGVQVYLTRLNFINNTVTGNTAFLGGGVNLMRGDITLPVSISNNIIEGNLLRQFGDGGGIYTHDLSTTSDPTIDYNDLWGNTKNQISGDRTDANTIGVSGNFSSDPRFVNRAARDFHLDPNSPAIDRALASKAPPVDFDNHGRGVDGNGIPNNPQAGDVDVGALELLPGCITFPSEVGNVEVAGASPTTVTFDLQSIGPGAHYEMISGLLSRLTQIASFEEDFCLMPNATVGSYQDSRPAPPPGDGWYYLVRAANGCGAGTYGSLMADSPRSADVCPGGIVDLDFDGSPSDLDCNEANPDISPLQADLCNGVDDNCNIQVDEGFVSQPTTCGVGACASIGGTSCVSGVVGDSCVPGAPGPSDTTCNGVDENCNGQADEQFTPQPTTCGVGVCQSTGVSTCAAGVSGSTCVPGTPMIEICDNLDNNCDAAVDEGFDVGGACTGQTGTCQGPGAKICDPEGSGSAICNAFIALSVDLMSGSQVFLSWTPFSGVAAYDIVRGDLTALGTSSGDFTLSTDQCLADNLAATSMGEPSLPAPGNGYWYLARGSSCGFDSYDESGSPSQVGPRGSEIQASALACP